MSKSWGRSVPRVTKPEALVAIGFRLILVGLMSGAMAGCGLPNVDDIRGQYVENVQKLSAGFAVYPPREMIELGQLWIADASTVDSDVGVDPEAQTSLLLSDGLATAAEIKRDERMTAPHRQNRRAPIGASDKSKPFGATDTAQARAFTQPTNDTLELGSLPKYKLASVNQAALSGGIPGAFQSFLGSLGFARAQNLSVEAVGLEIAELPFDQLTDLVVDACSDPENILGDPNKEYYERAGFNTMKNEWRARRNRASNAIPDYEPKLLLIRKVFYMRGMKYTYHDARAARAVASAALANPLPEGQSSFLTAPTVTLNVNADGTVSAGSNTDSTLQALEREVQELRTSVGANGANNINLAGSFVRSTGREVELFEIFQRPVALGYVANEFAMSRPCDRSDPSCDTGAVFQSGIRNLCGAFGG